MSRKFNSRRLKNRLWFTLHGTAPVVPCHWCAKPLAFNDATVDHEPPLSKGGHRYKAVIACWGCNQERNRIEQQKNQKEKTWVPNSPPT